MALGVARADSLASSFAASAVSSARGGRWRISEPTWHEDSIVGSEFGETAAYDRLFANHDNLSSISIPDTMQLGILPKRAPSDILVPLHELPPRRSTPRRPGRTQRTPPAAKEAMLQLKMAPAPSAVRVVRRPRCAGPARRLPESSLRRQRLPEGPERHRWSRAVLRGASLSNLALGWTFFIFVTEGTRSCARADAAAAAAAATDADAADAAEHASEMRILMSRLALLAAALQLTLSALGITLASGARFRALASRIERIASCVAWVASALYPPFALLLWFVLSAVSMYCVTFRLEVQGLLRSYWTCAAPSLARDKELLDHANLAALLCGVSGAVTALGLFSACTLISWRSVLRAGVIGFNVCSALIGAALLPLSATLQSLTLMLAIILLGILLICLSVLGFVAARDAKPRLLCIHGGLLGSLGLVSFLVCATVAALSGSETQLLSVWIERMQNGGQVNQLLSTHRLTTAFVAVLVLFALLVNVVMSCGLRVLLLDGDSYMYGQLLPDMAEELDEVQRPKASSRILRTKSTWLEKLRREFLPQA